MKLSAVQTKVRPTVATLLVVVLLVALLAACAGPQKRRGSSPSTERAPVSGPQAEKPRETMGPPEAYGPFPDAVQPQPNPSPPSYGPEPISLRPLVLVLGPGLARGFSYVGVIRALHEAKIPIGAIVGTEVGALVGALYAMDASINHFEFNLLRFKDEAFTGRSGSLIGSLFSGKGTGNAKLDSELEQVFGDKNLEDFKIPLRVAVFSTDASGQPTIQGSGKAVEVLTGALKAPGLIDRGSKMTGAQAVAKNPVRGQLIQAARALNIGAVAVVDALDPKDSDRNDLAGADLVIHPEARGFDYFSFERRTDIAFRGKRAVQKHLTEIRKWVGLPESGPQPDAKSIQVGSP